MPESYAVQLRGVTKRIGGRTIVDSLTFDVQRGEVFGLLGPNGAGKTTTIRMMVGLMAMSEGEVLINGFSVGKQFEKAMRHIGAIVENPEMYKFLTGYQNLIHYARMNPGITRERIDEAVRLVRLENRIHDKVKTYSLGMRQRLGVAQAILHNPAVLVLDEPTNGLDPEGIREMRTYLRTLASQEGVAVIVSSHLLSEMELMCDRVAIIQNGKLIDIRTVGSSTAAEEDLVEVEFIAGQAELAASIARTEFPDASVSVRHNGINVMLRYADIPVLVRRLAERDVDVYGVKPAAKTLEDQFLEVTGGGQID
jgi:ABC-2 type transport system ATP-binding protein